MNEIKCIYKNGDEKVFNGDITVQIVERYIEAWKAKKGILYTRLLESPLKKLYIDGQIAIDKDNM